MSDDIRLATPPRRFTTLDDQTIHVEAEDLETGFFANESGAITRMDLPPVNTHERVRLDQQIATGDLRRVADADVVEELEAYHVGDGKPHYAKHYRLRKADR